jgi:hypothetical protein
MARNKKQIDPTDDAAKAESDAVGKWLTRVTESERYRKMIAEKYHWLRLLEEYRGFFAGLQDATDIVIPSLNLIFAYVKSEIPSLYLRNPKIKVNPKKGSSILAAKILEKALNYIWRTKRIKRENKKNIFDTLLVGHSWFKTGYTGKFGTIEDGEGNVFEFIENEDFFGYRVPYENITFNPDANDPPYDCSWIAHEVLISEEDARKRKNFKNLDQVSFSTMRDENKITSNKGSTEMMRYDPVTKKGKFIEVWDKTSKTKFILAEGVHAYIEAPTPWPYELKGFPFSFLKLNEDPFGPYGIPDCAMFEELVLELMKLNAAWIDHIKRYNRQLLVAEGHISDDAMDQFTQGITGAIIPVRTDGQPISNIIAPIPYPQLQPDIYGLEVRLKEYMVRISGQSGIDQGGTEKTTTRSLGELDLIQEGGKNRRSDKVDTIEDFVEDISGNLVALLQQLADVPLLRSHHGRRSRARNSGFEYAALC